MISEGSCDNEDCYGFWKFSFAISGINYWIIIRKIAVFIEFGQINVVLVSIL